MFEHVVEGCSCNGKRCTQCKVLKCHQSFHTAKKKFGRASACKECVNAGRRLKRQANLEETRTYHREYRRAHAEQLNAINRQRYKEDAERRKRKAAEYQTNAEYIKARRKEYQQIHVEKIKAYKKMRYQANAEDFKQQKRVYYQEKADSIRVIRRHRRKANPSLYSASDKAHAARRRASKAQADGYFSSEEWLGLKEKYNFTCLRCGKREPEIRLSADHVIPLVKGGKNSIDNIQPLCISCNSQKYTNHVDYRKGAPPDEQQL